MSTTLPLFWHLSSAAKKERIDASLKLIGALEKFQSQFTPGDSSSATSDDENDEADAEDGSDGLDAFNAQDVSYSIRRLVRGLASPRESSRLGFSVALTELLSRLDSVTCSQVLSLVMDASKPQGSVTGQEERDLLFARLFGLTAIIRSGLLVRSGSLSTSASSSTLVSTPSSFREIIAHLVVLGEKKSWLRESAWWVIALAVDAVKEAEVDWKEDAMKSCFELLFIENKVWSPEKIALALKLQQNRPNYDWKTVFSPTFKNTDLLASGNLPAVARILKESASDDEHQTEGVKSNTGSWKPQLHFVWDLIVDQLLPGPNTSPATNGSFQEFFRVAVDESLFSSTSSSERKYWGFQVFQKALPRVSAKDMPMLFTKNFMRSWINHLSHEDRHLHKVAKQVAVDIKTFVDKNPTLGFTLILQLTGVNGSSQFDKLTRTKTVESILSSLDIGGIKSYIDHLFDQVDEPVGDDVDVQVVNSRRMWIVDQLASLIRNGSVPKEDTWIQTVLDWLVVHGLFVVNKKSEKSPFRAVRRLPSPVFSDKLRESCRARLLSCLADLSSQATVVKQDDKTTKTTGVASDGQFWVSRALETVHRLQKDTKHASPLFSVEEDLEGLRTQTREICERLRKVDEPQREPARGAELLLQAFILHQYCALDEEQIDMEPLETCLDAANRMFFPNKKSKKARKSDAGEALPEPIDNFVDTIIGFLEKSISYLRVVGNQTFSLLSGSVQESTVDLILTQLESRDPSALVDGDGSDGMEVDGDEVDEDEEEESESDEDEEEEDEGDDSNDEEPDLELRKKIEDVLRANGIEAATGETDESDEEIMDDDQMMAIDTHLAEMFKMRSNANKSGKDINVQREATHFKNRVLDLVDTFIKRQPGSSLVVRFIVPLLDLISSSGQDERQLEDKAKGLLRSRIGKLKEVPASADAEAVIAILDEIHLRARKTIASEVLSQCSLYVSRILIHVEKEENVLAAYRGSLSDFATRKNSALKPVFFHDFLRVFPATAWGLRKDVLSLSETATNVYRKCQTLQLLQVVINQLPPNTNETEVTEFMASLRKALMTVLLGACDGTISLTAAQAKELLKLALSAIRQTKRLADVETAASAWDRESWENLQEALKSSERFKSSTALQTMSRQAVQILDSKDSKSDSKAEKKTNKKKDTVNSPKSVKRKAEVVNGVGEEQGGKKVKRRKRKED